MRELKKVAYVFPGQGAQYVGMGDDIYKNSTSTRALFEQVDESLGFSLSKLCFEGPENELTLTVNVQPAIVATSLALLSAAREYLGEECLPAPDYVAGHSLGEYTALAAAGVLSPVETIRLARARGQFMQRAAQLNPGTMLAVIGLDEEPLAEICACTGTYIANFNCPGQMVISGAADNLGKAREMAKARGALRAIPLQVSGAFHTPLMEPAMQELSNYINEIDFNDACIPVIANTTAQEIKAADSVKQELINQLCHSVRWQQSIEYLINQGVGTFIEIGPGSVLAGLIRRINREVKTVNISNVENIKNLDFSGYKQG
jgi:[acyl-carrier-protein] S-malonyltransferase